MFEIIKIILLKTITLIGPIYFNAIFKCLLENSNLMLRYVITFELNFVVVKKYLSNQQLIIGK